MRPGRAQGFTLIELMVTLAIVAVLARLALPLTQLVAKRAKEHELRANLRTVRDALDRYNELWRYSCTQQTSNGASAGGQGAAGTGAATIVGGINGAAPVGGSVGAGGNTGGNVAGGGSAGSVGAAGLGGAGGVSASTVQTIGGNAGNAATVLPTPPKMECTAGSTGWPKDLQVLVDGVTNIASAQPGAKVYFLRRIPRDPLFVDSGAAPIDTWGKRSSASSATEPQEGDDVFDVYSLSTANDITGRPYREW